MSIVNLVWELFYGVVVKPVGLVLTLLVSGIVGYRVIRHRLQTAVWVKPVAEYRDKVVIVTGASGGIGSEIVKEYAKMGSRVAMVARNVKVLEALRSEILKNKSIKPDNLLVVPTDLTKESECKAMVDTVVRTWSKIDICVWNAGVGSLIEFEKLCEIDETRPGERFKIFRDNMDINYFSLVYSTSYALPFLKQSRGSIVVVSSLAGKFGTALRSSYSASKFAVQGFFNSLRNEIGDQVQVNITCPGFVLTEFHNRVATIDNKPIERESKHFMTPKECAELIVFSERSNQREILPDLKTHVGNVLQPILPELIDFMTNKTSKSSLKHQ